MVPAEAFLRSESTLVQGDLPSSASAGLQGDLERSRGLPVSILCDRERNEVPKSQMTFLEYVVKPTFEAIQVLLPSGAAKALRNVEGGRQHWEQAIQGTCNGVAGTSNGVQAGSATLT